MRDCNCDPTVKLLSETQQQWVRKLKSRRGGTPHTFKRSRHPLTITTSTSVRNMQFRGFNHRQRFLDFRYREKAMIKHQAIHQEPYL